MNILNVLYCRCHDQYCFGFRVSSLTCSLVYLIRVHDLDSENQFKCCLLCLENKTFPRISLSFLVLFLTDLERN